MKLIGKITFKGTIEAKTGLHIGGNKTSLEIGGVDMNVIKTGRGLPYIPGSSFKGKLRSLLAKVRGSMEVKTDHQSIKNLFGDSGANDNRGSITRLFVRDAHLDSTKFDLKFGKKDERLLDYDYSEVKTENRIDRSKGTAKDPRQIERVPAGAIFNFNITLDLYEGDDLDANLKLIKEAFTLLNIDYLGGHGSRGSGEVEVKINSIDKITIDESDIINADTTEIKKVFSDLMTVINN